jgi:hypothetical protein
VYVFRGNATLCVFPIAIVHDGRRFRRRRDKMYDADYLASTITFIKKIFTGISWAMRRNSGES